MSTPEELLARMRNNPRDWRLVTVVVFKDAIR
jgi:hypothetical protein